MWWTDTKTPAKPHLSLRQRKAGSSPAIARETVDWPTELEELHAFYAQPRTVRPSNSDLQAARVEWSQVRQRLTAEINQLKSALADQHLKQQTLEVSFKAALGSQVEHAKQVGRHSDRKLEKLSERHSVTIAELEKRYESQLAAANSDIQILSEHRRQSEQYHTAELSKLRSALSDQASQRQALEESFTTELGKQTEQANRVRQDLERDLEKLVQRHGLAIAELEKRYEAELSAASRDTQVANEQRVQSEQHHTAEVSKLHAALADQVTQRQALEESFTAELGKQTEQADQVRRDSEIKLEKLVQRHSVAIAELEKRYETQLAAANHDTQVANEQRLQSAQHHTAEVSELHAALADQISQRQALEESFRAKLGKQTEQANRVRHDLERDLEKVVQRHSMAIAELEKRFEAKLAAADHDTQVANEQRLQSEQHHTAEVSKLHAALADQASQRQALEESFTAELGKQTEQADRVRQESERDLEKLVQRHSVVVAELEKRYGTELATAGHKVQVANEQRLQSERHHTAEVSELHAALADQTSQRQALEKIFTAELRKQTEQADQVRRDSEIKLEKLVQRHSLAMTELEKRYVAKLAAANHDTQVASEQRLRCEQHYTAEVSALHAALADQASQRQALEERFTAELDKQTEQANRVREDSEIKLETIVQRHSMAIAELEKRYEAKLAAANHDTQVASEQRLQCEQHYTAEVSALHAALADQASQRQALEERFTAELDKQTEQANRVREDSEIKLETLFQRHSMTIAELEKRYETKLAAANHDTHVANEQRLQFAQHHTAEVSKLHAALADQVSQRHVLEERFAAELDKQTEQANRVREDSEIELEKLVQRHSMAIAELEKRYETKLADANHDTHVANEQRRQCEQHHTAEVSKLHAALADQASQLQTLEERFTAELDKQTEQANRVREDSEIRLETLVQRHSIAIAEIEKHHKTELETAGHEVQVANEQRLQTEQHHTAEVSKLHAALANQTSQRQALEERFTVELDKQTERANRVREDSEIKLEKLVQRHRMAIAELEKHCEARLAAANHDTQVANEQRLQFEQHHTAEVSKLHAALADQATQRQTLEERLKAELGKQVEQAEQVRRDSEIKLEKLLQQHGLVIAELEQSYEAKLAAARHDAHLASEQRLQLASLEVQLQREAAGRRKAEGALWRAAETAAVDSVVRVARDELESERRVERITHELVAMRGQIVSIQQQATAKFKKDREEIKRLKASLARSSQAANHPSLREAS